MLNHQTRLLFVMPENSALQQTANDLRAIDGLEVQAATDLDEALKLHQQLWPQVIVVDYALPPTNGLAVLAALRESGCQTPVIIGTEAGSEQQAVACLRAGAADYLHLPASLQEAQAAIQRTLTRQRDVTPQRDLAAALVDDLAGPILVVDDQNRLLYLNTAAQQLLAIPEKPPPGSRLLAELTDNQQVLSLLSGDSDDDADTRRELSFDDSDLTLMVQSTAVPGLGRALIMYDISSLKAADRVKSDFIRRVSSDIRSPLTTIQGYVEMLGKVGPVNEVQQRFVDRITFSVQSIGAMLSALLGLSQIEAGYDLELQPTQLLMIVRYAIDGSRRAFEDSRINLTVKLPEETPAIMGSPTHLRQMVDNLLDNARKSTPTGGMVGVSLSVEGDFLLLQVSDNGIGIPVDDQPHVFEQFYRAANIQSIYEGAGLGLSIVQRIVDRHQGRIWLDSRPGSGTRFTIMLPAWQGFAGQSSDG